MTTFAFEVKRCSVCGAVNKFSVLSSTNSFGSPDLDLRPAPMERMTMEYWIQECPNCGYVSGEVSDKSPNAAIEYLCSDEYRSNDGISFASDLAGKFYKHYKISLLDHKDKDAFFAIRNAAWDCDDKADYENAVLCRKLAVEAISKLIESNIKNKDTLLLVKADLMRRAGYFDRVISEYADVRFSNTNLNKILAFELSLAEQHDSQCYRVSDVK